jgi:hypothetical protein
MSAVPNSEKVSVGSNKQSEIDPILGVSADLDGMSLGAGHRLPRLDSTTQHNATLSNFMKRKNWQKCGGAGLVLFRRVAGETQTHTHTHTHIRPIFQERKRWT